MHLPQERSELRQRVHPARRLGWMILRFGFVPFMFLFRLTFLLTIPMMPGPWLMFHSGYISRVHLGLELDHFGCLYCIRGSGSGVPHCIGQDEQSNNDDQHDDGAAPLTLGHCKKIFSARHTQPVLQHKNTVKSSIRATFYGNFLKEKMFFYTKRGSMP